MKIAEKLSNLKGIPKVLWLVLCAFVFALPFINEHLWICSWFGLSGLFLVIFDFKNARKGVYGSLFCFFFFFYVFSYSWFVSLYPLDFAGLSNLESAGVVLCALTLIPGIHAALMSLCVYLAFVASYGFKCRLLRVLTVASGYVIGEFLQGIGTFAFPWTRLFVAQTNNIFVLQSACLFGAKYITLLIVAVNVLIALALMDKKKKYAFIALCLFALNFSFGLVRVNIREFKNDEKISVMALQGNISSVDKWLGGSEYAKEVYLSLAEDAAEEHKCVDIAVLPETAFPATLTFDGNSSSVNASKKISKLLCADTFVGAFKRTETEYCNSLYVFSPDGKVEDKTYDKINLVPFGEFMPYRSVLEKVAPALAEINLLSSDLTEGTNLEPLETSHGKAACLVCFDSVFSETARKQVKNGAEFIVISTNDSWYKTSKALEQHASHAVMRAIENGRGVVRCANTGISVIVSPVGKIISKSGVNTRECIVGEIPLCQSLTLYTRIGDIITPVCFAVIVLAFLKRIKKRLPKK